MQFTRLSALAFFLCGWLAFDLTAQAAELRRDILGISLSMPKADAQKRLQEIGKFVRDERKRQEIWEVRDERFSHVIVGFDAKETLRFVTAVAREDKEAKRPRYTEIGDVQKARQAGDPAIKNFNYEWAVPAAEGAPEMLIIARGRDPEFLTTYSLKRIGDGSAEEEDEKK